MIPFLLEIIMQLQMPYGRPLDAVEKKDYNWIPTIERLQMARMKKWLYS